jgi:hypothetical protein
MLRNLVSSLLRAGGSPLDLGASTSAAVERRIIRVGIVLTSFAVLGQSVIHLINVMVFDLGIGLLNADADGTVFAWASVVVTFLAAAMAALLAALRPRHAVLLLGLAAALVFLSLDDSVQIHERVSELKTQLGPITHFARTFWPLVYLPLLAAVFWGLAVVASGMRPALRRLVILGLGLLVAAILLEMASPVLFVIGFDHGDLGYELEAVIEEGAELGGWMLVALALAATVCTASPNGAADKVTAVRPPGSPQ